MLQADGGPIKGIERSLDDGWLRAIALTASSYTTGQSMTWVHAREECGDPDLGAAAAQERDVRVPRRSRDGLGGAAVLLPGRRSRRRVVRRWRDPVDGAAVAGGPSRRAAHHRRLHAIRPIARGSGSAGGQRLSAAGAGGGRPVQRDLSGPAGRRRVAAAAGERAGRSAFRWINATACGRSIC